MQLIFRKNIAKNKQAIVVLTLLLSILVASSKFPSQPVGGKTFNPDKLPLASDPINYTIGVSPNEEYTWIITSFQEKNIKLVFGSNWTDVFGLSGTPQKGYKFKVNITSTQDNGTHYLLDYALWDCVYRTINFSIVSDRSHRYDYLIFPQNYSDGFDPACLFPLFFPTPPLSYIFASNLSDTYYDTGDFTSYGGGLYVYYDRQINIGGYDINLNGMACYLENGVLDYFRFGYQNGSEAVDCLLLESFKPYYAEESSLSCQVGDEFTWVLVNYNSTVLEQYFGDEFFEKYGLLPHPERMQSIKMKVEEVSENDTNLRVDYSLYNFVTILIYIIFKSYKYN